MYLEGPVHYQYKRDGGRVLTAVAFSESDAESFLRSVFSPGERVRIYWPATSRGSAYAYEYTIPRGTIQAHARARSIT